MTTRYFFTPPTVAANPRYLDSSSAQQKAIMRFYKPLSRGVNVFVLADGTVVQDTPTSENANADVPYPIGNPNNLVSRGWNPYTLSEFDTAVPNPVVVYFLGGHVTEIGQAMAAQLTAAGYSGNITTSP